MQAAAMLAWAVPPVAQAEPAKDHRLIAQAPPAAGLPPAAAAAEAATDESPPAKGAESAFPAEPAADETPPADSAEQQMALPGGSAADDGQMHGPRDLLRMFDIGDPFFATFVDDEPLAFDEQEKLFRLLYRVVRIPTAQAERWARGGTALRKLAARPAEFRGELFRVQGVVHQVDTVPLTAQLRARFELPACYRCRITAEDGTRVSVLTPAVPKQWPLDQPFEERVSFVGMFVKQARIVGEDAQPDIRPLQFVAARVAWYPVSPLGKLHMDVGLLDDVRDRRPLTADERECFYQLLAAVGRTKTATLDRAAQRGFEQRSAELTALLPQLATRPKEQLRVRHELEQAKQNRSDVLPLFLEPDLERGKLVVLEGRARRALEVQVDEPDVVERFGFRRYFELEIFPEDSQGNPVVCCVRDVSPEMPLGDTIDELVRVTGFFVKSWMYRANPAGLPRKGGPPQAGIAQRLAPLVIAREAQWIPAPGPLRNTLIGVLTGGGLAIISTAMLIFAWRGTRGHRSYRQIVGSAPLGAPDTDRPDFSNLK
jgi:hypothetical protein